MRKIRLRRKKKKKGKYVDMLLEKDGEQQTFHMETNSLWKMAKAAKKLAGLNRKGWVLISCSGTDPDKVSMFNNVAAGYVPSAKESLEFSGLKGVPKPLKKFFSKDEEKESQ